MRRQPRTPHKGQRYVDGVSEAFVLEVKSSRGRGVYCSEEDWQKTLELAFSMGKLPLLLLEGRYRFLCFDLDVYPAEKILNAVRGVMYGEADKEDGP
jgi:Holliday junction resolvase